MCILLLSGANRNILLATDIDEFRKWVQASARPPGRKLIELLGRIADLPAVELLHVGNVWKYETGTDPKIYVVKRDMARMYCCMKGRDIVILGWSEKKQEKADQQLLRRMQKLAQEVLDEK